MSERIDYGACRSFVELQQLTPGNLNAWMTHAERERLFQLAKALQPRAHYVELGIFTGCTVALFALIAPSDVYIAGIDDFSNQTVPNLRSDCIANLEAHGVRQRVELICESSHVVGPQWQRPIDVLLVDGDHTYWGMLRDLHDFAPWMRCGGLLLIDDYTSPSHPEVYPAVNAWLAQEPPQRWATEWTFPPRTNMVNGEDDGVYGKMLGLRRQDADRGG